MSHYYTFVIACFLGQPVLSRASAEDVVAPTTASETVSQFFSALSKGEVDRAVSMTAPLIGVSDDAVRQEYAEMSQFAKAATLQIVAHLQLGETAVVIFREGGPSKTTTVDLDPAYLVRRDNKWYVIFTLTRFDRPYHKFDETTQAKFKKLEGWYDAQKPQLQRLLAGTQ